MKTSFKTIKKASQGIYKERGSKFLSFAYPVLTGEEVNEKLSSLRKKYHDARHHCYAYVLGSEGKSFRVNDDGEPGHSAGDPILGAIRSKELTNVLVVVIRYFGGIKLGVGGLIQAYKISAAHALNAAEVIEKDITIGFRIEFNYSNTSEVMQVLNKLNANIIEQSYETDCKIHFEVKMIYKESMNKELEQLLARSIIKSLDISLG